MNKTKFLIYSIFCLCLMTLVGCASTQTDTINRIKNLVNISVPSDSSRIYNLEQENYFAPGIMSQYTVFSFEEEPTEFLTNNLFQNQKDEEFESHFDKRFEGYQKARLSENIAIPDEYIPDWDKDYLYLKGSSESVSFVYMKEDMILIVYIMGR